MGDQCGISLRWLRARRIVGGQTSTDHDVFAFLVNPDNSYRTTLSTSSASIDLCATAWSEGSLLAVSPGCSDGHNTPSTRNATLDFVMPNNGREVVIDVFNVLGIAALPYQLQLQNQLDDYPNSFTQTHAVFPLRAATSASGVLNSTTDVDVFRYDRRTGESGTLVFALQAGMGLITDPTISVRFATGTAGPGGVIASGVGTVTVPSSSPGRYYAIVSRTPPVGSTGSYSLRAQGTSCGGCSPTSYANALPLPSTMGGISFETVQSGDSGADTPAAWSMCASGQTCTWYTVAVDAFDRVSASVWQVGSPSCDLELGLYGPEAQQAFELFDGTRIPIFWDRAGSLESGGASISFEAQITGNYRLAVRSRGTGCNQGYRLGVVRNIASGDLRPPVLH